MSGGTDVVVGRQGIYTADGLAGYELRFGSVGVLDNRPVSPGQMTAAVIFAAVSIGLDQLVGDRLLFCKGDRGLITGEIPLMLPAHRTVVEVMDSIEVDDEVLRGCARLAKDGFALALNSFGWANGHEQLLPLAAIVKVDVMMTSGTKLSAILDQCQGYDVQMLAEHVSRSQDVPGLAALGFELFQGFALDRPDLVRGRTLDANMTSGVLAAVALLNGEPEFEDIEQILKCDPALAYQIIRLASIGRLGEPRRDISSIHDALVLAGTKRISNWLALLLARPSKPGTRAQDAFLATLLRARACELLAAELGPSQASLAFAAGMLSALDYQLEMPLEDVIADLPLSDELRAAVTGGEGPVAAIVRQAMTYQTQGGTPETLHPEQLDAAFAQAFTWALQSAAAVRAH